MIYDTSDPGIAQAKANLLKLPIAERDPAGTVDGAFGEIFGGIYDPLTSVIFLLVLSFPVVLVALNRKFSSTTQLKTGFMSTQNQDDENNEWTKYERVDDSGPPFGSRGQPPEGGEWEDRIAQGARTFRQDFLATANTPIKRWGVVVMGASVGWLILILLLSCISYGYIYGFDGMFDNYSSGYWRYTRLGLLAFPIGFCMWLGVADKLLAWIRTGGSRP